MINSTEELTQAQISKLSPEDRPGYEGEDDVGRYKVDIYGIRRRPFQKGGPSPNPKGTPVRSFSSKAADLMAEREWMSPLEFYMAVLNCDIQVLNSTRKGITRIKKEEIRFQDQMFAASKTLPYFAKMPKKEDREDITPPEGPTTATLSLPSAGRRGLAKE